MSKRHVKTVAAAMARTERPVDDGGAKETRVRRSLASMDSLVNVVAGLGTDRDKKYYSDYGFSLTLTRVQLENIFRASWAGKRIVKAIPEDMTREWVSFMWDGADDDIEGRKTLKQAEQDFALRAKVLEALTWASLYGGAGIVMGIVGDETPEAMAKPLRVEALQRGCLRYLHVLDRWRLGAGPELVTDLGDPDFGQPKFYILAESGVRVHRSRMVIFNGERLPWFLWRANAMWHDSVLQHIYDNLRNYDTVTSALATMMFEQNIDVVANDQTAEALTVEGGESALVKRYQGMALMKSVNRLILIDKEHETYDRKQNSFAGMDRVGEKFMFDLCGAADIPFTRLFGQAPAGMNSTGESDMRNYYDRVKAKQQADMVPQLFRMMGVLVRHALGEWPTDFRIECNSLYQMSAVEKMNVQKTRAERDQINVQNGFVTEGVVTAQLKEDGVYSMLEDDDVDAARELSEPMGPGAAPPADAAKQGAAKVVALTPTAMAGIITVNEARRMQGLADWPDADGGLTILEFQAKHGGTVAAAVNAEAGQTGEADKSSAPSGKAPPAEAET